MPTKIIYGQNSLKDIDTYIKCRKTLLITSQGFVERGLVEKIVKYTNNIVKVISNIKSHPEFLDVREIYDEAHQTDFELIVAIGGGSVLDVSKFVSIFNESKDYMFVEGLAKGKIEKKYRAIPVISIPTTSGTGSEVTPYSTIWDSESKTKYSLCLPDLFSEVAIYDPMLTLTVPKDVTIQTGLDALSHALESIWNKNANSITLNYAVQSAKIIINSLVPLSNDLNNIRLRDAMMRACMYAGLAFSNTQTAVAHGMSYYITTHKGVSHGIACSFTLPVLIDSVIGKHKFIDTAIDDIFGELDSMKLRSIFEELGVSTRLKDYGLDSQDIVKLSEFLRSNERAGNSLVPLEELLSRLV